MVLQGLLDTGTDNACINLERAQDLDAKIYPTRREILGADSKPLNIVGETVLKFSCECCIHKGRKEVVRRCFVFAKMNTDLLILYSLTTKLKLIKRTCSHSTINNIENDEKEESRDEEDHLEGIEIYDEEREVGHLSDKMKEIAEKYKDMLRDSLAG